MTPAAEAPQETPIPISVPEAADKKRQAALNLLDQVTEQTSRQQIVAAEIAREMFEQDWRLARVFQQSGQFKDLKKLTEGQAIATAMAKIRLGRGWNLNETEAMQYVVFINGVPTVQNEIVASRLMDAGYHWDLLWEEKDVPGSDKELSGKETTGCILLPKYRPSPNAPYEPILDAAGKRLQFHFGRFEASRTMIYEDGKQIPLSEKWNFKSYPRDMFYWRCIARFKRQHVPNILSGARLPFEAEEMEDPTLHEVAAETDRRAENDTPARIKAAEDFLKQQRARGTKIHEIGVDAPATAASAAPAPTQPPTSTPPAPNPVADPPKASESQQDGQKPQITRREDQVRTLSLYREKYVQARKGGKFFQLMAAHLGTENIDAAPFDDAKFMGLAAVLDKESKEFKPAAPPSDKPLFE